MNLNIESLRLQLGEILKEKTELQDELLIAYNQEHFALVQNRLLFIMKTEASLNARFLVAESEGCSTDLENMLYSDLIIQRLRDIYASVQIIEDQKNMGHNEEHGRRMDLELEFYTSEEERLAVELQALKSKKSATDIEKSDLVKNLTRTLSIPSGELGLFERQCMSEATNMLQLLLRSYQSGELSTEDYNKKNEAVNSKLKFFTAKVPMDFSVQIQDAVLDTPHNISG